MYKGILSVISPSIAAETLHVHLQQFLFEEMAKRHERVTLDNTTQVSIIQSFGTTRSQDGDLTRLNSSCFAGPHRR